MMWCTASTQEAAYQPAVDYFPITAHPEVFHFSDRTAI